MCLVLFKFKDGKQPHSVKTSDPFPSFFMVCLFLLVIDIW